MFFGIMPDEFAFVEFVFEEFDEFVSVEFGVWFGVLLSPELLPRMRGGRRLPRLFDRNMIMKIILIRFHITIYLVGLRGARRVRRLDLNLLLAKQ